MATPFPFTSGQVLTAAQMNSIGEAGITYTPTISALGGTVTTASATAKYVRVNKLFFVSFTITCTTAGTAINGFNFSMPAGITGVVTNGTAVGLNRETNVTGNTSFCIAATSTNMWILCTPANGTSFSGTFTLETA